MKYKNIILSIPFFMQLCPFESWAGNPTQCAANCNNRNCKANSKLASSCTTWCDQTGINVLETIHQQCLKYVPASSGVKKVDGLYELSIVESFPEYSIFEEMKPTITGGALKGKGKPFNNPLPLKELNNESLRLIGIGLKKEEVRTIIDYMLIHLYLGKKITAREAANNLLIKKFKPKKNIYSEINEEVIKNSNL